MVLTMDTYTKATTPNNKLDVSKQILQHLQTIGFTIDEISKHTAISSNVLKKILEENSIPRHKLFSRILGFYCLVLDQTQKYVQEER